MLTEPLNALKRLLMQTGSFMPCLRPYFFSNVMVRLLWSVATVGGLKRREPARTALEATSLWRVLAGDARV